MAEIKWIKITTDIFDDDKIKIIDRLPARDEILVIWFKLLALAGKVNQNGLLFLSNRIPYTTDMLAAVFNRDENTVKMALAVFEKYGMIYVEENEVIAIANWEKHQNVDEMAKIREQTRLRVQNHREKQKLIAENPSCNVTEYSDVTLRNDVELELDKEKDIDIKSKDMRGDNQKIPPSIEEIREYCQERNNNIDPEKFFDFYDAKGWMIGKNKMKNWKAAVRTWEKGSGNSGRSIGNQPKNPRQLEEWEVRQAKQAEQLRKQGKLIGDDDKLDF